LGDAGHPALLGHPYTVRPLRADDHDLPVHGVRHRQLLHWIRDGILSIRQLPVHGVRHRLLLHWIRGGILYWMRHFSVHGVRHRLLLHWIRDGILCLRHLPVHGVRHRQLLHWIRDGILSGGSLRGCHQRRQLLHHVRGLRGRRNPALHGGQATQLWRLRWGRGAHHHGERRARGRHRDRRSTRVGNDRERVLCPTDL